MKTALTRTLAPALLVALCAMPAATHAKDWPSGPVKIVVPFTAGGSTDVVSRIAAEKLTKALGQSFIVENRPGAGGTIGSEFVAKSAPDGNTLLVGTSSTLAIAPYIYRKLAYQPLKDFTPVSLLGTADVLVAVNAKLPVDSVQALIDYGKQRPGKLTFGSGGVGSISHLLGEYFKSMASVDMLHVPYKGDAQMVTDLVGGQLDMAFGTAVAFLPYIRGGQLKALAVTNPRRSTTMTDLPTIAEAGVPGYEAVQWFGIVAPTGTPPAVVKRLNESLQAILAMEDVQARFRSLGFDVVGGEPQRFASFLEQENTKWRKIATVSGTQFD